MPLTAKPPYSASIMVVDDQPANLKLLENMLRREGYRVRSFPRGRLALAAAVENAPDLILLDINMPEMNGYEVCRRLKADTGLARIPVIFLSALDDTRNKVKAFGAGGADYVTKPFQFEEVQARVETQLGRRRLEQELERHNLHLEELVAARTRELAEAHERLKILDRTKNEFLHLISHELRTPLNGLLGVGQLLLELSSGTPDQGELCELFDQSSRRILSFVDDALLITQIDLEPGKFSSAPVALAGVLNRAAGGTAAFARSNGVRLGAPSGDAGFVGGNEELLVRALEMLLKTAVKFSQAGDTVGLLWKSSADSITLIIETPNGSIPTPAIGRFFELLSLGEHATSGGNLGLGPPGASRIVSIFGGSVSVENRDPSGIRLLASFPRVPQLAGSLDVRQPA